MKRKVWIFVMVLVFVGACSGGGKADKSQDKKCYLFSYFKNRGTSGMHLAYSYDGLKWEDINGGKAIIEPTLGEGTRVIRDPHILRGANGTFHVVFTAYVKPLGFGYAHSKDLIHFSKQKAARVMANEPNAINCWAPELFYDDIKKEYLIFWSSTVPGKFPETDGQGQLKLNHRIYCCRTKDFETFSESRMFYNDGFNVIDATIVKEGERYVMFLKDETNVPFVPQKNIKMAFADKPSGPYNSATKPITDDYWCEGPSAIKIGGSWYMYFDKFMERGYGVLKSKDLKNWEDISQKAAFPEIRSHGTVFEVSRDVLNKLLEL